MAIISSQPVEHFDKLAINLAVSPMWKEDSIGISVAMRLTPYCYNEEGKIEKKEEAAKAVVYGDATVDMQNDPTLAKCVTDISNALQEFITTKGL